MTDTLTDHDKAAVYDAIADYLRKEGWVVDRVWKHPATGTLHENWHHPDYGVRGENQSLMNAYKIECYRDAPSQGDRMAKMLEDIDRTVAEKKARRFEESADLLQIYRSEQVRRFQEAEDRDLFASASAAVAVARDAQELKRGPNRETTGRNTAAPAASTSATRANAASRSSTTSCRRRTSARAWARRRGLNDHRQRLYVEHPGGDARLRRKRDGGDVLRPDGAISRVRRVRRVPAPRRRGGLRGLLGAPGDAG